MEPAKWVLAGFGAGAQLRLAHWRSGVSGRDRGLSADNPDWRFSNLPARRAKSTAAAPPSFRASGLSLWARISTLFTPSELHIDQARMVLLGLAAGIVCYAIAELSTPLATSTEEHDLWLTRRLGFLLAPALALCLGWLQRSWRQALIGSAAGLLIGALGFQLCSGRYQPLLLALPILLAAVLAAFCGSPRTDWLRCFASRFAKGLAIGLLIGLLYIALLAIGAIALWPRGGSLNYLDAHIRMMWRVGPLALGVSAALLLPALQWAVGPARARTSPDHGSQIRWTAAAENLYDNTTPQSSSAYS